jgi:NitT/TauT family transport system ATP-binding protein
MPASAEGLRGGNGRPPVPAGGSAHIEVSHLSVEYAASRLARATLAVSDVSFCVGRGERWVIIGPSGCGKSTLLKAMGGLLEPSAGSVRIGEGGDARIGFVFQADALLPWRTALANVELAARFAGCGSPRERSVELMEQLGLGNAEGKYPSQLSGGMRKRVALARALAYDPSVFFMDEPFGALDAQTRISVGNFLLGLLEKFGQTIVFVTHDLDEAIALADRILVMTASPGAVADFVEVPLGKPRDYYESRFEDGFTDLQKRVWELIHP